MFIFNDKFGLRIPRGSIPARLPDFVFLRRHGFCPPSWPPLISNCGFNFRGYLLILLTLSYLALIRLMSHAGASCLILHPADAAIFFSARLVSAVSWSLCHQPNLPDSRLLLVQSCGSHARHLLYLHLEHLLVQAQDESKQSKHAKPSVRSVSPLGG